MLQANGRLGDWGLEYTQKQPSLRLWVESTQMDARTWTKGRQRGQTDLFSAWHCVQLVV